ncbi:MAG TPA: hypothetical protein VES73_09615 [Lamprocystis sp. (in: g-proteobacteria)]|nr:hypothetical protein [Lamprocystis sp. (in: g-proteobacteria)]
MKRSIDWRPVLCGLALATVAAMPSAGETAGGTVRVAGGTPSGDYITFARATCDALGSLFVCNAVETKGSLDNVERLRLPLTDPAAVDIAFVQGNVADQLQQAPGFNDDFVVVRNIAGEAVFLVMTPETAAAVRNWAGIKNTAFLLSMGLPGEKSGDTAAFNALRAMADSPLQALEVKQYQGRPELLAAVRSGAVRIGWLVQYPNPDNALFQAIDTAGLVVMGVVDPDFVQLGGAFGVQDVTVANAKLFGIGGAAKRLHTTTVKAAIAARAQNTFPDLRSQKIQDAAIRKIQEAPEADILPKKSWITDLINKKTFMAKVAVGQLYDQMTGEAVGAKERVGQLDK